MLEVEGDPDFQHMSQQFLRQLCESQLRYCPHAMVNPGTAPFLTQALGRLDTSGGWTWAVEAQVIQRLMMFDAF